MPAAVIDVDCVVLGSGVIGLTTALELSKQSWRPAIVARDLPSDEHSTSFASPWAVSTPYSCPATVHPAKPQGANWHSFESDPESRQLRWDIETYKRLEQLADEVPHLVARGEFVDIYDSPVPIETVPWRDITKDVSATVCTRLMTVQARQRSRGTATSRSAVRAQILFLYHQCSSVHPVPRGSCQSERYPVHPASNHRAGRGVLSARDRLCGPGDQCYRPRCAKSRRGQG